MTPRRLLIVSPHFPPTNAPDHQRIRACLSHYRAFGWEPTVLAIHPDDVLAPRDESLAQLLPGDLRVHRVRALPYRWTRLVGMGTLGLRALPAMRRAGDELLAGQRFDLVLFSTTQHAVTALGPRWLRRFNVPYVVDIQDPWRTDYYRRRGIVPPGGALKFRLSQCVAAFLEPNVMRNAAHLLAVSPHYLRALAKRYPAITKDRGTVLPFGFAQEEYDALDEHAARQTCFDTRDGMRHWVYAGACGPMMRPALDCLFRALASVRKKNPTMWSNVRLHFVGTSYAVPGVESVLPVARRHGVEDLVREQPARIGHLETLRLLRDADVLMLVGSDDAGYSASKAAAYLFAGKPLAAVVHGGTPVARLLESAGVASLTKFDAPEADAHLQGILEGLTASPLSEPQWNTRALDRLTARHNARIQCTLFDRVLAGKAARD
ncbi:MAG: hypothetical protein PWP23_1078 [Candidatus Sumerlaeota bacterium]|nr:hypothetical protein [Candidatus Sumerlaeota bacterium]